MTFILWLFAFVSADKVDDAISWMYDNGLTIHNNKTDFNATRWLRRDEAAKFYVSFAKLLWKTSYVKTTNQCIFSDINNSWSDLKDIVIESCRLGLFQWSKWKFNPANQLTNAQAVAVLVRLLAGNQNEIWLSHRANNYYTKANELGILTSVSMNTKDSIATRGNVGVIIWNGKDKNININNSTNLFCGKNIEILSQWQLISENSNEIIIKTDKQDTAWYDVYIKGKSRWNESLVQESFQNNNIIAQIDCAPWICYWVKINTTTMCWIDREIYSNQPRPSDFPNDDWARYPKINAYESISDQIGTMLENSLSSNTIIYNKSTLTTFSDTEVWISFSYPSSWWTITKNSETNSWNKYLVMLLKNWNTFFTFHNWWTPVARWGFWGDWAQNINNTWFVYTFCQTQPNCTIKTNINWVEYAKYIYQYGQMWSSQTYTWIGYMIFNPNSSYRGIIMSNERIPNESISDLDAIINSLSFI